MKYRDETADVFSTPDARLKHYDYTSVSTCAPVGAEDIVMYPFYKTSLPGLRMAKMWLQGQYGGNVLTHVVCSEGLDGNAWGMAPPIRITDFSPAALE